MSIKDYTYKIFNKRSITFAISYSMMAVVAGSRQRTHVAIAPRFPPRFPSRFQGFQAFAGPIPGPAIARDH